MTKKGHHLSLRQQQNAPLQRKSWLRLQTRFHTTATYKILEHAQQPFSRFAYAIMPNTGN